MVTTRIDLVAATFTNITTQFEALGNRVKFLTTLTDVSIGIVKVGHTPTTLRAITGGTNGPAAIMSKPEGSTDTVWAYSTDGGNLYLHGNDSDAVEYVEKNVGIVANPLTGSGISAVAAAIVKESIVREGDIIHTRILIDLTGLDSSAGTDDIIGKAGTANCWFYQVTTAKNGVVWGGQLTCIETPATGDTDVDLFSATESTGVEDAAVSGLTQTQLLNGASIAAGDGPDALSALPVADAYLYFVGAGSTNATYSAGRFMLEFWGLGA